MNQVPFEQLTYVRFAALVKTPFRVRMGAGQQVELELAEAREFPSRGVQNPDGTAMKNECFSLLFKGPVSSFLPQGTYDFEQDNLGAFSLFVVPIGQTAEAFQYEVIFNRLS